MRQYSSFAGIVFGRKTRKFFTNLVRLGLVSTYDCAHNRGRVYHVRHRAIYEAIGQPHSRLRRPPGVPRALERLMLLDAILENPDSVWISARAEKIHYFSGRGIASRRLLLIGPSTKAISGSFGSSRIACRSAFIHPATSSSFTCMQTRLRDEFRDFLQRHAPLLERLPAWTVLIVVPPHLADVPDRLQKTAWIQLASPLSELLLTEAAVYFDHRGGGLAGLSDPADWRRFERCERAFATDRYTVLYRCWLRGRRPRAGDRLVAGYWDRQWSLAGGTMKPLVLPHAYSHLAPMASVA